MGVLRVHLWRAENSLYHCISRSTSCLTSSMVFWLVQDGDFGIWLRGKAAFTLSLLCCFFVAFSLCSALPEQHWFCTLEWNASVLVMLQILLLGLLEAHFLRNCVHYWAAPASPSFVWLVMTGTTLSCLLCIIISVCSNVPHCVFLLSSRLEMNGTAAEKPEVFSVK